MLLLPAHQWQAQHQPQGGGLRGKHQLSSDDFNLVKQKNAYYPFADRRMIMESIRYVDKVIIEDNWEQKD